MQKCMGKNTYRRLLTIFKHSTDIVLKVRQPLETEIGSFKEHGNLISFLYPGLNKPLIEKLAQRKLTTFGWYSLITYLCSKS